MDELYGLRCKVAHTRGYFTSLDLDKLSEMSKKIAVGLEGFGENFLNFLNIIFEHPVKRSPLSRQKSIKVKIKSCIDKRQAK